MVLDSARVKNKIGVQNSIYKNQEMDSYDQETSKRRWAPDSWKQKQFKKGSVAME